MDFLTRLYSVYIDFHFVCLDTNPLVIFDSINGGQPHVCYLDLATKLNQTVESIPGPK